MLQAGLDVRKPVQNLLRWIVQAVLMGHGPTHQMKKLVPSAVAPGTAVLPDRVNDCVAIRDRHPIDGHRADGREDPLLEFGAIAPLRVRGCPVAPKIHHNPLSGFPNGRNRVRRALRARVTAPTSDAPVLRRCSASARQGNSRVGAEPKVTPVAGYREAQGPTAGIRIPDVQVQAIAVSMATRTSLPADQIGELETGTATEEQLVVAMLTTARTRRHDSTLLATPRRARAQRSSLTRSGPTRQNRVQIA